MTSSSCGKWLSLIGIGEDGIEALSPAARTLLAQAQLIVGGARHLALAGPLAAKTMTWPSPLAKAIPDILAQRGAPVCVLASGDPFFYGVGSLLSAHIDPAEIHCVPAPSAFSLAAARLKWSLQECRLVSLHGREFERIIPALQPRAKILCLSWDETTPPRLAKLLCERGLGQSRIIVMEAMGGPRERLRASTAEAFSMGDIDPLNLVRDRNHRDRRNAQFLPVASGLADDWFETDGQLTKREVRAIALSSLAPRRGELLWDVGAGSGSIAIEWLLCDPANRAIAIEARADRASRIARNASEPRRAASRNHHRHGARGFRHFAAAAGDFRRRRRQRHTSPRRRLCRLAERRPARRQRGDPRDGSGTHIPVQNTGRRPGAIGDCARGTAWLAFTAGARPCRSPNGR